MKIKIAQIVGLNTDQTAAQVLSQTVDEEVFLAVLDLTCDDAFTRGRSALSELADAYFEAEGSTSEKLSKIFEDALKKFADSSFDLVLAVIAGKILYLTGKGDVEVYLKRLNKLTPLLSIGSEKQLISGFVEEGDKILLSTKSLVTFLGDDLEQALGLPLDAFEDEVSSKVGARPLPIAQVQVEEQNEEVEDGETEDESQEKEPVEEVAEEGSYHEEAEQSGSSAAGHEAMAALAVEIESPADQVQQAIPPLPQEEQNEDVPLAPQYEEVSSGGGHAKFLAPVKQLSKIIPKSGRGRLIFALVLLLIVGGGIGFKYKTKKDKERQDQFNASMQSAKDDFAAAKGLSSLTPSEAKAKLDAAKNEVAAALKLEPGSSEAKDLQNQINGQSSSILQESAAKEFPVFLDLGLIKKNFQASGMSLSDGKLLILDPAVKTLVVIDVAKKSNQILAGSEQLGDAQFASLNGDLGFIYSKDKGVLRVDTTNKKVTTPAKVDKEWGSISDIYGFGSNIYLLDAGNNQIWKYVPTTEGYSDKREYFTKDTKVSLADSLRMQIESSVYILKKGGEMLRFTKGVKDNFSYSGLDKGVKDPKSFFVSSDTDNLYLLDSGNSRLLILTKTGEYKGQISGDKFATATDLVVDEKAKLVYLLDGGKIYTVNLQ